MKSCLTAAAVAATLLGGASARAEGVELQGFRETALVRALVEQDVAWLAKGPPDEVLGRKLFGLEFYNRVAEVCASPSSRKQAELRRLKWHYLAELFSLPAERKGGRRQVLAAADHAEDDAEHLVDRVGCDARVTRRIVAEVGE